MMPLSLDAAVGAYHRPHRLDEALTLLAHRPCYVLAGGTDLRVVPNGPGSGFLPLSPPPLPADTPVLDITALESLQGWHRRPDGSLWIGALCRWAALAEASLPAWAEGLGQAARCVGSTQIRHQATLGGNLCTASPAADSLPPLLCLDPLLTLISAERGERRLPLADFLLGPRRTALAADELLLGLTLAPPERPLARSGFAKLAARQHLTIAILSVAGLVVWDDSGILRQLRLAVGAASPVPCRLPVLETHLAGSPASDLAARAQAALQSPPAAPGDAPHASSPDPLAPLSPIDDIRADAPYRLEAAREMIPRLLAELVNCLDPP